MVSLGNHWAEAEHQVTIITLSSEAGDMYRLDPRVQRVPLAMLAESRSLAQAIVGNVVRIRAIRRRIRSLGPDVVISFNTEINVLALLACMGLGVPVVISERVHPPSDSIKAMWNLLRRLTYRLADALVVQSEKILPWARAVARPDRIHVIPNAVSPVFVAQETMASHRVPMVLGVGRLVPQKGFDLLIRAFASIAGRHPNWSLTIVGQGPEEATLKMLAARILSPGAAAFPGAVPDPERYYRSAGLFVLASRFEGFPNVLLEAMATGCAVIAADCPVGPSEIIRQGIDGVLVPPEDVGTLAGEMDRLMGDGTERGKLGARAREVASRFSGDRIMERWDNVIGRVRE